MRLNQDVGSCVSAGVHLDGERDVAKGNCLVVRQSILEKILPSRKDVPLLAHARQVDIHDTELMMGDDDGFLSVVISNRLPVAGVDAKGDPAPVKYLACLINLEGQFHRLIPEAPEPRDHIQLFNEMHTLVVQPAVYDHVVSGGLEANWNTTGLAVSDRIRGGAPLVDGPLADSPHAGAMAIERKLVESAGPTMQAYTAKTGWAQESKFDIYETMADGFRKEIVANLDPQYTFPCLLHWSFVSTGSTTFETLMRERLGPCREPAAGPSATGDTQASPPDRAGAAGSGRDRTCRIGPADAPRRQHSQLVPRATAGPPEQRGTAADRPCLRPAPCRDPGRSRGHLVGRRVRGRPAARHSASRQWLPR